MTGLGIFFSMAWILLAFILHHAQSNGIEHNSYDDEAFLKFMIECCQKTRTLVSKESRTLKSFEEVLSLVSDKNLELLTSSPLESTNITPEDLKWDPNTPHVRPIVRQITGRYHGVVVVNAKHIITNVFRVLETDDRLEKRQELLEGLYKLVQLLQHHLMFSVLHRRVQFIGESSPEDIVNRCHILDVTSNGVFERLRRYKVGTFYHLLHLSIKTWKAPTFLDTANLIANPQEIFLLKQIGGKPSPDVLLNHPPTYNMPYDYLILAMSYYSLVKCNAQAHYYNLQKNRSKGWEVPQDIVDKLHLLLCRMKKLEDEASLAIQMQITRSQSDEAATDAAIQEANQESPQIVSVERQSRGKEVMVDNVSYNDRFQATSSESPDSVKSSLAPWNPCDFISGFQTPSIPISEVRNPSALISRSANHDVGGESDRFFDTPLYSPVGHPHGSLSELEEEHSEQEIQFIPELTPKEMQYW